MEVFDAAPSWFAVMTNRYFLEEAVTIVY